MTAAKFTFLVDGDGCTEETFSAILKVCADQLIGCNRIIVFRGEHAFPLNLADTTKPYRDLLDKIFFSDIPHAMRSNSASFTAYSVGHANAHTGNMKDHVSDIITQSIPFLSGSREKKQYYVFVSTTVKKEHMVEDSFRIRRPDDLMQLAEKANSVGGGGATGVESLMSMIPNASRLTSLFQNGSK